MIGRKERKVHKVEIGFLNSEDEISGPYGIFL